MKQSTPRWACIVYRRWPCTYVPRSRESLSFHSIVARL